jgi:hypothetical protein
MKMPATLTWISQWIYRLRCFGFHLFRFRGCQKLHLFFRNGCFRFHLFLAFVGHGQAVLFPENLVEIDMASPVASPHFKHTLSFQ